MLYCVPTANLTGITIRGDFKDFYELVNSIHWMTRGCDDPTDVYYGVNERLLGVSYDIRHAYMGNRENVWEDNGMSQDIMEWHNIKTPVRTVYFSVNVLFPEAIFVAASAPRMSLFALRHYGKATERTESGDRLPQLLFSDYL